MPKEVDIKEFIPDLTTRKVWLRDRTQEWYRSRYFTASMIKTVFNYYLKQKENDNDEFRELIISLLDKDSCKETPKNVKWFELGHIAENLIINNLNNETGDKYISPGLIHLKLPSNDSMKEPFTLTHRKIRFDLLYGATPDGICGDELLEIKAMFNNFDRRSGPNDNDYFQTQWQMLITGKDRCRFCSQAFINDSTGIKPVGDINNKIIKSDIDLHNRFIDMINYINQYLWESYPITINHKLDVLPK